MNTETKIAYLGDTSLSGAAAYLAGVMTDAGLCFSYTPSDTPASDSMISESSLYIISDYPVKNFSSQQMEQIAEKVRGGAGLLMIGGWESFHGQHGEYPGTPIADLLPVTMSDNDDRTNCPQPCLVEATGVHPILDNLDWHHPPGIGGYNLITAREHAEVLLQARPFLVSRYTPGEYTFEEEAPVDLLVVGQAGAGRVAAYAGDVAPHWVGGLVDWGDERVVAQVPGGNDIEVGSDYARFFTQLVRWTAAIR